MHHLREILRLSREKGLTGRAIAQSLSLSPTTVTKYLKLLEPLPWPLPEPGGEALLAQVLEKKKTPAPSSRIEPDWEQVHRELQSHKGVTLLLLWEEYRETARERGYSDSRFCVHYAAYARNRRPGGVFYNGTGAKRSHVSFRSNPGAIIGSLLLKKSMKILIFPGQGLHDNLLCLVPVSLVSPTGKSAPLRNEICRLGDHTMPIFRRDFVGVPLEESGSLFGSGGPFDRGCFCRSLFLAQALPGRGL